MNQLFELGLRRKSDEMFTNELCHSLPYADVASWSCARLQAAVVCEIKPTIVNIIKDIIFISPRWIFSNISDAKRTALFQNEASSF